MSKDSVIFSKLQTKAFEDIQKILHDFIGKDIDHHQKESEVADTEQVIWNTLKKMRRHIAEMFWSNQNRTRKKFDEIEDDAG